MPFFSNQIKISSMSNANIMVVQRYSAVLMTPAPPIEQDWSRNMQRQETQKQ
jgi:hypothetical protein